MPDLTDPHRSSHSASLVPKTARVIDLTNSTQLTIDSLPSQFSMHRSGHDFLNDPLRQNRFRARSPGRTRLHRTLSLRPRYTRPDFPDPLHPLLRNGHGLPLAQHYPRMAALDDGDPCHGDDRSRRRHSGRLGHEPNSSAHASKESNLPSVILGSPCGAALALADRNPTRTPSNSFPESCISNHPGMHSPPKSPCPTVVIQRACGRAMSDITKMLNGAAPEELLGLV